MTKARDLASSGVTLTSTTTTADAALARAGGTMTGDLAMGTNLVDGVDVSARDAVLTSTTTLASAALPKSGGAMTGAITTNSTFDGVDIATRDAVLSSTTTTATNALNNANNALPKEGGAMTGPITTNSTFDGVDVGSRDSVLTSTTTTANAALPKTGGAMTGAITTNSTFDGVDIATRDAVLTATTTTANAALPKAGGTMTGNLGIGTSPSTKLHVKSTSDNIVATQVSTNSVNALFQSIESASLAQIGTSGSHAFTFFTANQERMRIDSSGTVGIGVVPSAWRNQYGDKQLDVGAHSALYSEAGNSTAVLNNLYRSAGNSLRYKTTNTAAMFYMNGNDFNFSSVGSGSAGASVTPTLRMRINSSGNVLVGKTVTTGTTAGHAIYANGTVEHTLAGGPPLNLRRTGSDGNMAVFRKDSVATGVLGSGGSGTELYIAGSGTHTSGAYFDAANQILPMKAASLSDNTTSLGKSSIRWKDLYLSGGVYLGGTGAANKLEDYEEGTWSPVLRFGGSSTGIVQESTTGKYTKIGRTVFASFNILLSSKGSQGGAAVVYGLPFPHFQSKQHSANNLIFESNGAEANKIGAYAMPWSDSRLYLRYQGASTYAEYTNTNFTNSTKIFAMITYETLQ